MDRTEAYAKIGSEWQKGNHHRIYFNDLGARLGVETSRYNTGNISYATQDGLKISNAQAKRILSRCNYSKFWYDVNDGKFHTKGELTSDEFAHIIESIKSEAETLING